VFAAAPEIAVHAHNHCKRHDKCAARYAPPAGDARKEPTIAEDVRQTITARRGTVHARTNASQCYSPKIVGDSTAAAAAYASCRTNARDKNTKIARKN